MKIVLTEDLRATIPALKDILCFLGQYSKEILPQTYGGVMFSDSTQEARMQLDHCVTEVMDKHNSIARQEDKWTFDDAKRVLATDLLFGDAKCRDIAVDSGLFALIADSMHICRREELEANPYYRNIKIEKTWDGGFFLGYGALHPYEYFEYNETAIGRWGASVPKIGFFEEEVRYPGVMQDGETWMTITPNEINTMAPAVDAATGNVLTIGLGMGYYAYMVSLKEDVQSVTIVEKCPAAIHLFEEHILPQFEHKEKIRIICADGIEFLNELEDGKYDYCFADIWRTNVDFDIFLQTKVACNRFNKMQTSLWIEDSFIHACIRKASELICKKLQAEIGEEPPKREADWEEQHIVEFIAQELLGDIVIDSTEELTKALSRDYIQAQLGRKDLKYVPLHKMRTEKGETE